MRAVPGVADALTRSDLRAVGLPQLAPSGALTETLVEVGGNE